MYIPKKTPFDVSSAVNYLASTQEPDGSFGGNAMYTDWAIIALSAADSIQVAPIDILEYMKENNRISSSLTDIERHAMAILALNENPYSFYGVDYITPIIDSFDGKQFGDPSLVNDDIFALIPLVNAGYGKSDEIILKDIDFIISKQKANGSWEESVDITAASIQALEPFESIDSVSDSISQAIIYLQSKQENYGGFGSVYSTSWVAQAMSALETSWTKNSNTVFDYLTANQSIEDGAVLPSSETIQNRIWATSYAIPAVLEKSWDSILHPVSKPKISSSKNESEETIPETVEGTFVEEELVAVVNKIATPINNIKETEPVSSTLTEQISVEKDIVSSFPLSASAENSKTKIPPVVAIGVLALISTTVFLSLKFIKFK
jgi:squalene cyclase